MSEGSLGSYVPGLVQKPWRCEPEITYMVSGLPLIREEVYGRYHRGYNVPGVVDQRSPLGQIGMNLGWSPASNSEGGRKSSPDAPGHFDDQDREAR